MASPTSDPAAWYASVLLNRLMFVYFLQKKGFLDRGDHDYLGNKLDEQQGQHSADDDRSTASTGASSGRSSSKASPSRAAERAAETTALLGDGPLPQRRPLPRAPASSEEHPDLDVPDEAFEGILGFFDRYTWHLDDTPGGKADEINPDVLGYIFEKYINQKAFGAYYTPPEITDYLCDATIDRFLVEKSATTRDAAATLGLPCSPVRYARGPPHRASTTTSPSGLLGVLTTSPCSTRPCGSGAFLVAALKKLLTVYTALVGYAAVSKNATLKAWHDEALKHPRLAYFLKKEVITRNLYGVDLMPEAIEIAKLRLFLALVASAEKAADLEPLPNIDFNLLAGNSLLGLLDPDAVAAAGESTGDMFAVETFREALDEKNRLVDLYRGTAQTVDRDDESGALLTIRDRIHEARQAAQAKLNEVLRLHMKNLGVQVQKASWTGKKASYKKRGVTTADVTTLTPFHWAYEFSRIMARGGFDIIVTNPPWDILKPNDKEFFEERSDAVSKNKMRIEDFLSHRATFLAEHDDVRAEYEAYLTSFPHQSAYFRAAPEYANQIAVVNGRKQSSDLNLYKLFLERGFRLLHDAGHCGIVIPSGHLHRPRDEGAPGDALRQDRGDGPVRVREPQAHLRGRGQPVQVRHPHLREGRHDRAVSGRVHAPRCAELARFPDEGAVEMDVDTIKRLSRSRGASWSSLPLDASGRREDGAVPLTRRASRGAWKSASDSRVPHDE